MPKRLTLCGFRESGGNGKKVISCYCFAIPEHYEKFIEKAEVTYDAEEIELAGAIYQHTRKVFEPVNRKEFVKSSDYKTKLGEYFEEKLLIIQKETVF